MGHPCNPGGAKSASSSRSQSAPPTRNSGQRAHAAGMSADERLARELQEQELSGGQDSNLPGSRPKKKSVSSRIISMFACFKKPQARTRLLNGGASSSSSQRYR